MNWKELGYKVGDEVVVARGELYTQLGERQLEGLGKITHVGTKYLAVEVVLPYGVMSIKFNSQGFSKGCLQGDYYKVYKDEQAFLEYKNISENKTNLRREIRTAMSSMSVDQLLKIQELVDSITKEGVK